MKRNTFIVLLIVFFSAGQTAAKRVYVRAGVAGANNGTSWSDAHTDLQAAIASSSYADTLWVAGGTFKPTTDTSRAISFSLSKSLTLFGGFGGSETSLIQRNLGSNPTILSGDIGLPGDTSDNTDCVIDVSAPCVIDGFRITGGQSNYAGGGLTVDDVAVTIRNCEFIANYADYEGCAIEAGGWGTTTVNLENCLFSGNAGGSGGAINAGSWGKTRVTMKGCIITGNATEYAAAINAGSWGSEVIALENCVIHSNHSGVSGGVIEFDGTVSDTLTLLNCTISGNTSGGVALRSVSAICTLSNTILWEENALGSGSTAVVSYSSITKNPRFADSARGDFRLGPLSPCIDAADGNTATPLDFEGNLRADIPSIPNTGAGLLNFADIGAYEFRIGPQGAIPFITSPSETSATQETLFRYVATAFDLDNDPVTFSFPGLPSWLSRSGDTLSGFVQTNTFDTAFTIVSFDGRLRDTLRVVVHNLSVIIPKNGVWTIYNTSNGLKSNAITAIEIDHLGNKWIGTYAGLHKLSGNSWTVYTDSNTSLPSRAISCVYEDRGYKLWVGTVSSGLASLTGTAWQTYTIPSIGNRMHTVIQDNTGTVWVGAEGEYRTSPYAGYYGYGLASYSGTSWTDYRQSPAGTRSLFHVQNLARAPNGDLWFALRGVYTGSILVSGMLLKKSGATWSEMRTSGDYNAVACDRQGITWAGTAYRGVMKYDSVWTTYDKNDGLLDTSVNAIAVDSLNNKWIGTNGGLCMRADSSWTNYVLRDGLPGLTVTAIAVQRDTIWIGTNNGLAKFTYRPGISVELVPKLMPGSVALGVSPNPFRAVTGVHYDVGKASTGRVVIYDLAGRKIFSVNVTGRGALSWNAGTRASGLYVCTLAVKGTILHKTMVLVK